MVDWGEVDALIEIVLGGPFVFLVLFSRLMRAPAKDAWFNAKQVFTGRMSFFTLAWKPGFVPPADTYESPEPMKLE